MRHLVTGAAGLIGSWMAQALANEGHKVFGLDDFSGGSRENIDEIRRNVPSGSFQFIELDLNDHDRLKDFIMGQRPEIVVHAAACAREGASPFQPLYIVQTNILATTSLLEACIPHGMKKFCLFSSMAVSGDNPVPFTEDQPRKPVDIYGSCKAASEEIVSELARVHGFQYTIIRPHNVIGPRQNLSDPYRNVAGIVINRIMRKEPLYLYGKGHTRAFSYIEDSLPAFVRACDLKVANGEIIFVGGKEAIEVEKLFEVILEEFNSNAKIIELPVRPLEVKDAHCSIEKSQKLLGYKEKIGWRQGIHLMAEWAKKKGPQEWRIDHLPLINKSAPLPWIQLDKGER